MSDEEAGTVYGSASSNLTIRQKDVVKKRSLCSISIGYAHPTGRTKVRSGKASEYFE